MINELVKSFKAAMYERMGSPFFSALLIFFVYFNWKAIFILFFSDMPVMDRIMLIEGGYTNLDRNLYYPVIYAFITSIVYPFVSLIFVTPQSFSVVLKRKIKNGIEKNSTIPVTKFVELRDDAHSKYAQYETLLTSKNDEIRGKNEEIGLLRNSNSKLVGEIEKLETMLGKQNAIYGGRYNEFVRHCEVIIADLNSHINTTSNVSVASFWNTYGNKFEGFCREYRLTFYECSHWFRLLQAWHSAIVKRMHEDNMHGLVHELTDFIREFVTVSEHVRLAAKQVLEADVTDDIKRKMVGGNPGDIKENWNNVRESANDIISGWKALLLECVEDGENNRPYLAKILSIGEPVGDGQSDSSSDE